MIRIRLTFNTYKRDPVRAQVGACLEMLYLALKSLRYPLLEYASSLYRIRTMKQINALPRYFTKRQTCLVRVVEL